MRFYKVRILKTGSNHFIEKNVCTENIELAKDIVINYLLKQCAEDKQFAQLDIEYHYKPVNNEELSLKINFTIPSKGDVFEFKIELIRDFKLEKFPEDIDIFNFINFSVLSQK